MTDTTPNTERDRKGRFGKGNKAAVGCGNPHIRKLGQLQTAVREALTAEQLQAVLQRLQELAIGGDVPAAKLLIDRCMGTAAPEEPSVHVDLSGVDLASASGLGEALQRVVRAACAGELQLPAAERLSGLFARVADAQVLRRLEERVAELDGEGGA